MIVATDRPCQQCRTSNLVRVNEATVCFFCDGVDSWPMCQPVEDLTEPDDDRRFTLRKGLELLLITAVCWGVVWGVAGLIIRWVAS